MKNKENGFSIPRKLLSKKREAKIPYCTLTWAKSNFKKLGGGGGAEIMKGARILSWKYISGKT